MKNVKWAAFLIAIISFLVLSSDPLNDTVDFIIAGSIPGTNISIGFWSTMALVIVLALIIRAAINNTRYKMILMETEENKKEKAKSEFEEANNIQFDRSKRSVIAARKSESAL